MSHTHQVTKRGLHVHRNLTGPPQTSMKDRKSQSTTQILAPRICTRTLDPTLSTSRMFNFFLGFLVLSLPDTRSRLACSGSFHTGTVSSSLLHTLQGKATSLLIHVHGPLIGQAVPHLVSLIQGVLVLPFPQIDGHKAQRFPVT